MRINKIITQVGIREEREKEPSIKTDASPNSKSTTKKSDRILRTLEGPYIALLPFLTRKSYENIGIILAKNTNWSIL